MSLALAAAFSALISARRTGSPQALCTDSTRLSSTGGVGGELVLGPADRPGEHLVGVVDAFQAAAVVVVGGGPGGLVEPGPGAVGAQQAGGGHHRVEVVVDRRVVRGAVRIAGGTRRELVRGLVLVPGRQARGGRVRHVELHRAGAAVQPVEAVVGRARRGERGLLAVDRGEQQPVDAERLLRDLVEAVEARDPVLGDVGGVVVGEDPLPGLLGVDEGLRGSGVGGAGGDRSGPRVVLGGSVVRRRRGRGRGRDRGGGRRRGRRRLSDRRLGGAGAVERHQREHEGNEPHADAADGHTESVAVLGLLRHPSRLKLPQVAAGGER